MSFNPFFMLRLVLLLFLLGIFSAIAGWVRHWWLCRSYGNSPSQQISEIREAAPAGCCGMHETCEKESLLAAVSQEIEYYEDEELDYYRGRSGKDYSDSEIEEFEEVLTTLRSEEVAGWVRSLQLREIVLPDALKDEVFLLIGERRGVAI